MPTRRQCANAIRALAIDAIEKANSGHPGAPLGMADMAEALWRHGFKHNPADPKWVDRDRFVLSNGHASMLLYALLHLTGYDLTMEDIENFRQWGSKTPGHPEYGHTPGVDITTGPLGSGISSAVGMALAERMLAEKFNKPGHTIVDHHTYVFLGDGCMMEGVSHEACSLAGVWKLGKLIALYDCNGISIDGKTDGWFTEDVGAGRLSAPLTAMMRSSWIRPWPRPAPTLRNRASSSAKRISDTARAELTRQRFTGRLWAPRPLLKPRRRSDGQSLPL